MTQADGTILEARRVVSATFHLPNQQPSLVYPVTREWLYCGYSQAHSYRSTGVKYLYVYKHNELVLWQSMRMIFMRMILRTFVYNKQSTALPIRTDQDDSSSAALTKMQRYIPAKTSWTSEDKYCQYLHHTLMEAIWVTRIHHLRSRASICQQIYKALGIRLRLSIATTHRQMGSLREIYKALSNT